MNNCDKQIWENVGTVAVSSSIRGHVVLRVLKLACPTVVACVSRISCFIASLSRSSISI